MHRPTPPSEKTICCALTTVPVPSDLSSGAVCRSPIGAPLGLIWGTSRTCRDGRMGVHKIGERMSGETHHRMWVTILHGQISAG